MWLFCHFIKEPTKASIVRRVGGLFEDDAHKEGKLKRYYQAVNYLLETYATDDVIVEAEAEITNYNEPGNRLDASCSETLWERALRCRRGYDDSSFKGVFVEGLHHVIRFFMLNHWRANKDACYRIWHVMLLPSSCCKKDPIGGA